MLTASISPQKTRYEKKKDPFSLVKTSKDLEPSMGHSYGYGGKEIRCSCGKTWAEQQANPATCTLPRVARMLKKWLAVPENQRYIDERNKEILELVGG